MQITKYLYNIIDGVIVDPFLVSTFKQKKIFANVYPTSI